MTGEGLLPCDVQPIIDETVANIQDAIDDSGTDDELLTSYLARFNTLNEDGEVEATFIKADDKRRENSNRTVDNNISRINECEQ